MGDLSFHREREAFGDRIGIRAPLDLRPRVHEAARVAGVTAAELIRQAVEAHVSRIMDEQARPERRVEG
ncbi:hypothetical protein [Salinarimonas soli]|uniref:Ribbon-helix-helix protein CopG domain-containing protein n=1 Tax=Salinarimonas soli TaxID=1638099 RepID=A0A5B2VNC1_9HYPH|nr:hypothetical protein [Salinarimonas soli]KAA2241153.1 hypothetical protein F0L46_04975 [Salinarimonas soli]